MNLNVLKGLLIILVIADHNEFTRSLFADFFKGLTFHVVGFMTIPFLKPPGQVGTRAFADYAFRLYWPFLLVTCGLWLVVTVLGQTPLAQRLGILGIALYSANADILKVAANMGLLWFLPSFISVVAIRNLIDTGPARARPVWIGLLVAVHGVIGVVAMQIQHYLPLGLLPALYIVPLAYAGVLLHRRLFEPLPAPGALVLAFILLLGAKASQMHLQLGNEVGFSVVADWRSPLALLINDLEAVLGTLMLFQVARLRLPGWIEACGKYSMQIYLFHAFIALGIYKALLLWYPDAGTALLFGVSMSATVFLTLGAAHLIMHSPLAQRLIFPRSLDHLLGRVTAGPAAPLRP